MTIFNRDMYLEQWVAYKAMEIGKECGEYCDHWYDYEKANDMQDSGAAAKYKRVSFIPTVVLYEDYDTHKIGVTIICQSFNPSRHYVRRSQAPHLFCNKKFPELEKRLAAEFNKFLGKKK